MGTIYARGAEFGAHIQFRDDGGNKTNIYGPSRGSQNEAQKDLDQIRAAGRVRSTREEGLKLMEAEAKQIKMSAEYQAQIQEAQPDLKILGHQFFDIGPRDWALRSLTLWPASPARPQDPRPSIL